MFKNRSDLDYLDTNLPFQKYKLVETGEQYLISEFAPNEFGELEYAEDYISTDIPRIANTTILDMLNLKEMEVEFDTPSYNEVFQLFRDDSNFDSKIEEAVGAMKIYGNVWTQITKEDDEVQIYNVPPISVRAKYDKNNPQKDAKCFTYKQTKEYNKKKYYLLISFFKGYVEIEAVDEDGKNVNPKTFFEDTLTEFTEAKKIRNEEKYRIETGLTYSNLQMFRNRRPIDEFYGRSDLTPSVLSKIAKYNRMQNLANRAIGISANPKLKLSSATARLLKAIKDEGNYRTSFVPQTPTSYKDVASTNLSRSTREWSWMMTQNVMEFDKKLMYFEEDGNGNTEYLVNPYKLDDLFDFMEKLEKQLYTELNVSQVLVNPEIAGGNKSENSYKLLMVQMNNHVETLQMLIKPTIQRIAVCIVELLINSKIEEKPKIIFNPKNYYESENSEVDEANQDMDGEVQESQNGEGEYNTRRTEGSENGAGQEA